MHVYMARHYMDIYKVYNIIYGRWRHESHPSTPPTVPAFSSPFLKKECHGSGWNELLRELLEWDVMGMYYIILYERGCEKERR